MISPRPLTRSTVIGLRENSNRESGVVHVRSTGRNQDGTVVALATRSCLMWTREAHLEVQAQAQKQK